MTRILHLTLHRQWFDSIVKGEKTEEYREIKPYWSKRISGKEYDEIHFTNGYGKDKPFMRVEYKGYEVKTWLGTPVYALKLGKILEVRNYA